MISKYANTGSHCDTYLPKLTQAEILLLQTPIDQIEFKRRCNYNIWFAFWRRWWLGWYQFEFPFAKNINIKIW